MKSGSTQVQSTETIDDRDVRALTSCLTVLPEYGRAAGADGLFMVVSDSGKEYLVDAHEGACECADYEYRAPAGGCKHVRRVAFATGERPIPEGVSSDAIDDLLGHHVEGGPNAGKPVAADGGKVVSREASEGGLPPAEELALADTGTGSLVFHDTDDGRELVGFVDVSDWGAVRDAVINRGLPTGVILHLPEFDHAELEEVA